MLHTYVTNSFQFTFIMDDSLTVLVGFEVLMVASMKMAVFWVVAPCSLVEVYQCFRCPCCLHQGSKDLWNVDKLLLDYTVLQPRRHPSSYSLVHLQSVTPNSSLSNDIHLTLDLRTSDLWIFAAMNHVNLYLFFNLWTLFLLQQRTN
jgi:hypothetical protein